MKITFEAKRAVKKDFVCVATNFCCTVFSTVSIGCHSYLEYNMRNSLQKKFRIEGENFKNIFSIYYRSYSWMMHAPIFITPGYSRKTNLCCSRAFVINSGACDFFLVEKSK